MKYIKLYENFENGIVKYSFSFYAYKSYEIKDDGYWTWEEVCDFLKSQGTDLKRDVASELGIEVDDVDDDNIDEYVNSYRGGRFGSWDRFKDDYGLKYEDNDLSKEDYERLKKDFNEGELEQYFGDGDYERSGSPVESFELNNLRVVDPQRGTYYNIIGTFETDRVLTEDQIYCVKSYISGQCSDGWGEGYEQHPHTEEIDGLRFDVCVHPWKYENWDVTINKI